MLFAQQLTAITSTCISTFCFANTTADDTLRCGKMTACRLLWSINVFVPLVLIVQSAKPLLYSRVFIERFSHGELAHRCQSTHP